MNATHLVYGVPATINSANFVYFQALEKVLLLESQEAVKVFTTEMLNLHIGQGNDIWWRDSFKCPTEKQYLMMAANSMLNFNKETGGLFRLATRMMEVVGTTDKLIF
jgi:geranylgeranyl diphosphate synthase type 3